MGSVGSWMLCPPRVEAMTSLMSEHGSSAQDSAEHVRVEREGEVAVLTLDRPDRLNAFTGRMGAELGRAYAACDGDDSVRAVVVTGAGRAFCAGADLGNAGDACAAP